MHFIWLRPHSEWVLYVKHPKLLFKKQRAQPLQISFPEAVLLNLYVCAHDSAVHPEAVLRTQADGEIYGAIYGRMYGPICGTVHHYGAASGRLQNSGGRLRRPPIVVDSIVVDGATYGTIYPTIYGNNKTHYPPSSKLCRLSS